MKSKLFGLATVIVVSIISFYVYYSYSEYKGMNDMQLANIEALSGNENSGSHCPNGCSDIGWGWNKILECDCNYDHFSSCDRWGC